MIREKAIEILRDEIEGEVPSKIGSIDTRTPEELIAIEIGSDDEAIVGQNEIKLWAHFEYCDSSDNAKYVKSEHVKNTSEEDRFYTPDGDDSGDNTWGLQEERERFRGSFYEDEEGPSDNLQCWFTVLLSEIDGIESGVRITLSDSISNGRYVNAYSFKMKEILDSHKIGDCKLSDYGELTLQYDIILGDLESFRIYGVKIFNTLAEDMVNLIFGAKKVIDDYKEPVRGVNGEAEELEP